ncbi:MAG: hypothetical protein ACOCXM_07750 [Myxococcota bacterium]
MRREKRGVGMKRGAWGVVGVLVASWSMGCSRGSVDTTFDGGVQDIGGWKDAPPVPLADLADVLHEDLCVLLTACDVRGYRDVADCMQNGRLPGIGVLLDAIEAGEIDYDPELAGRCHASLQLEPCVWWRYIRMPDYPATPSAEEMLRSCHLFRNAGLGTRENGQSCATVLSCAPGTECDMSRGCPGTCVPLAGLDEPCNPFVNEGPNCDLAQNLWCIDEACVDMGPWYLPCADASDCGGEECVGNVLSHGLCAGGQSLGEPCDERTLRCNPGLFCDADLDPMADVGTCRELGGVNAACASEGDCQTELHCVHTQSEHDPNGTCRAPSRLGEPCDLNVHCLEDAFCDDGICAERFGEEAPCTYDYECTQGLTCDDDTCVPKAYAGDPCDDGQVCQGTWCEAGTCFVRRSVGEECSGDTQCITGWCEDGSCVEPPTCEP